MVLNFKGDIWRTGMDILCKVWLCHRYRGYVWHRNVLCQKNPGFFLTSGYPAHTTLGTPPRSANDLCGINCLNTIVWIIQLYPRSCTLFHLEVLSVVPLINIQILIFPPNILTCETLDIRYPLLKCN